MSAIRIFSRLASLLDVAFTSPADGDVLTYQASSSKWKNAVPSGGGGSFDMLSQLVSSEVSVTGASTLTLDKMHVCSDSGTPVNYAVTLPAASGNAGKLIGVRMASGLTKLVTLTGHSAELIDGSNTRVMWAQEWAILLCDGTGWSKGPGRSVPMYATMDRSAGQSIGADIETQVTLDTIRSQNAPLGSTSSSDITLLRSGLYAVDGVVQWDNNSSGRVATAVQINGVDACAGGGPETGGSYPAYVAQVTTALSAGDVITLCAFTQNGGNTFDRHLCVLTAKEEITW